VSLDWRVLPLPRLRGPLALLFAVAFLAAGAMTVGVGLLAHARRLAAEIPDGAHYFVVTRAVDVDEAREEIARLPGTRVVSVRRAGEVLAASGAPEFGPGRLSVLEVQVPGAAAAVLRGVEGLRDTDAVVDVIDLNARQRVEITPALVARQVAVGVALLVLGCVVFLAAVVAGAQMVGRECREEIGVRVLLGAEPEGLWAPLGLLVGAVAVGGAMVAFSTAALVVRALALPPPGGSALPGGWTVLGAAALLGGTLGLALGAARRAVARAARATVLADLGALIVLGAGAPLASASPDVTVPDGPARDADVLRALSRDLGVCRRARHVARKTIAATERQAVLAAVRGEGALLRIAVAKRSEDLAALEAWERRCAALAGERDDLRAALHSARLLGPPITPRGAPVLGSVAVRYGQVGGRAGTAAFRNGVALRTRAGESVRASARGRVAYAGELPGSGPVVVVDHGRRTYSVYARIGRSLVSVGEHVDAGQTVARARSGLLYFSIRSRGRAVDPLAWVAEAPEGQGKAQAAAAEAGRASGVFQ